MLRTYAEEMEYIERVSSHTFRIKKGFVPNMNVSLKIWFDIQKNNHPPFFYYPRVTFNDFPYYNNAYFFSLRFRKIMKSFEWVSASRSQGLMDMIYSHVLSRCFTSVKNKTTKGIKLTFSGISFSTESNQNIKEWIKSENLFRNLGNGV